MKKISPFQKTPYSETNETEVEDGRKNQKVRLETKFLEFTEAVFRTKVEGEIFNLKTGQKTVPLSKTPMPS